MLQNQQLDKLSDLFLDLGKGLFLASFAISIFTHVEAILFVKAFTTGILCVIFSLKLIDLKN